MADLGRATTFNNHGPVQYQAGRDINPTVILSNSGFLDDFSLEELRQWASSKDLRDIQKLAAGRLKDRLASLTDADEWITQYCYTKEDLKVERLSGERLPLDQCYINLIGVPEAGKQINRSQPSVLEPGARLSDLSLWRRLNVQGPDGGTQIQLHEIFDAVKFRDSGSRRSKRILVRGQAGAGKTTFCKKAVHDFVNSLAWKDHFDRILWVRLRNLRFRTGRYNLDEFFRDEFFSQHPKRDALAPSRDVCINPGNGKTLFLLDGLDEIWHDLQSRIDLARFVTHLLNQPNVLVLSRPSVVLRSDIQPFDLELEMIGFNLDQVHQYVKRMEPMKYEAIKEFLESRPLVEDLVRIPIQLDALCYGWDQVQDQGPETMTDLYHAIEKGLWKKDIVQLGKKIDGTAVTEDDKLYDTELEKLVEAECCLVEGLAFTGICSNVAEFQERHLNVICRHFSRGGTFADRTLRKLSYLRTSDTSVGKPSRTYHFLHLTLQEYFAARYFVRVWLQKGKLICLNFDENGTLRGNPSSQPTVKPRDFLAKHKYSWRHDIMWRFVVGLLHSGPAGSDEGTMQFLRAVDAKPLDLLGLAHQRLTMHCLMELNSSNLSEKLKEHRGRLEDHLGGMGYVPSQARDVQETYYRGGT
ncbi:hypothetical protein NM208_g1507 [Fusarium decemcellulare]|uniref:Uncharacterized protein n=1 Tax=Fusarium decemcellulare TaxID=57161 RepID=A0ACC1SW58_9HYPO|nr:hypothetical protein NM208_g1507 [Fusarium decemcellulare]